MRGKLMIRLQLLRLPWLKIGFAFGNVALLVVGLALSFSSMGLYSALLESTLPLIEPFKQVVDTITIAGFVFSVSAMSGFGGTFCELPWMLLINIAGLGVILLMQLSIFIATFVIRTKIMHVVDELECEYCTIATMAIVDEVVKSVLLVITITFVIDVVLLCASYKLLDDVKKLKPGTYLPFCHKTLIHPITPKLPDTKVAGIIPLHMDFSLIPPNRPQEKSPRSHSPYISHPVQNKLKMSPCPQLQRSAPIPPRNSPKPNVITPIKRNTSSTTPSYQSYSPYFSFKPQSHSSPVREDLDEFESSFDSYKTADEEPSSTTLYDQLSTLLTFSFSENDSSSGGYTYGLHHHTGTANSANSVPDISRRLTHSGQRKLRRENELDQNLLTCKGSLMNTWEESKSVAKRRPCRQRENSFQEVHSPFWETKIDPNLPLIRVFPASPNAAGSTNFRVNSPKTGSFKYYV